MLMVSVELHAAGEVPPRFMAPSTIELLEIKGSSCSAYDNPHERCLTGRLLVHHCLTEGTVLFDVVNYPLDRSLSDYLRMDFGPLGVLAQHKIYSALHFTLLSDERDRLAAADLMRRMSPVMVYRVLPRVQVPLDVERLVYQLARKYREKTGRLLVITSGTRTPKTQARAMYTKLARGANLRRLYKKTEAVQEVIVAYKKSRRAGKRPVGIINAMAEILRAQVDRGIYLSPHLRAGAVDLRSRNMSRRSKRALRRIIKSWGCFKLNREERIPPHFHLEIYTGRHHGE